MLIIIILNSIDLNIVQSNKNNYLADMEMMITNRRKESWFYPMHIKYFVKRL